MNIYRRARKIAGRMARAIPWVRRQRMISCDYELISAEQARTMRARGWFSPVTARRQQDAYNGLLVEMRAGNPRIDMVVAAEVLDELGLAELSVLEVGCGGGYYSEIFARLPSTSIDYTGLDNSAAMVAKAQKAYPRGKVVQGDATNLQFADGAFDVIFNGVSLMHIPDYQAALAESARVARRACIFHSVPVVESHPTAYLCKYAYGGKVVEVIFNRESLVRSFSEAGLAVRRVWRSIPYDVGEVLGEPSCAETFLCVPS